MTVIIIVLLLLIFATVLYVAYISTNKAKNISNDDIPDIATESVEATAKEAPNTSKKNINKKPNNHGNKKKTAYRKTQKMRWRDKMLDISMIPKTVELDRDTLLPKSINREYGYGRRFNSFVDTADYSQYHRSTCTKLKSSNKQLVHKYIAICKASPCPDCTPNGDIDDWYIDFLNKNFKKFTSYADFQEWAKLPNVSLPETERYEQLSLE